jgi:hypothetical protein
MAVKWMTIAATFDHFRQMLHPHAHAQCSRSVSINAVDAHEFPAGTALCGSAGLYSDRPQMRKEGAVRAISFGIQ